MTSVLELDFGDYTNEKWNSCCNLNCYEDFYCKSSYCWVLEDNGISWQVLILSSLSLMCLLLLVLIASYIVPFILNRSQEVLSVPSDDNIVEYNIRLCNTDDNLVEYSCSTIHSELSDEQELTLSITKFIPCRDDEISNPHNSEAIITHMHSTT